MDTYKLEDYLHEYVTKTYNLDEWNEWTSNDLYHIDVNYISRGLIYAYNYNKDEIAIQQIPGLTDKIKKEFTSKFGLKFVHTLRESRNYDYPHLYPYYSIYKIVNRNKLLKQLKDAGFSIDEEISNKRRYNLPKYVCWDIRNTVMANKVWFGATLIKNGKRTNTAAKTVKQAMEYVIENRLAEKLWTLEQVMKYRATYTPDMEKGYSVELANKYSKCNRDKKPVNKTNIVNSVMISTNNTNTADIKRKRMYNLPKYVCYDKAESRNRERNVFQIQLKIDGKLIKNNLYTVKDATVYVASKMLEHTNIWSLNEIGDYLKTYIPDMENGNFVPSNTPKSPSWRKREKKKNIQTVKEQIDNKLSEVLKFAKDNGININIDVN